MAATTISIQVYAQKATHAMDELSDVARSSPMQERKHRRFSLQYPVRLKFHCADATIELDAVSKNISIGGLLLETSAIIPWHTPVSFIVTVRSPQVVRPIQFISEGKVVRVDAQAAEQVFAIAVECKRLITRTGEPLAATGS